MSPRACTVSLNPAIDRTLWVDRLAPGHTHLATGEHRQAGGKGFNVAAGLASLGVPVAMCGWLGRENAGVFEAAFQARGIADAMDRVSGHVRENLQLTDTARQQTTSVDLPGIAFDPATLAAAEQQLDRTLAARVAPGDWCLLTGSLPPGVDAGTLERLSRSLSAAGARLVVDTGGEALADLLRRLAGTPRAMPVFVKPNRDELEALCGRSLPTVPDVVAAARGVVAQGVPHVLVSLGADGAVLATAAGTWTCAVPAVPICTTVGAGDAVVAGTTAGLMAGLPFDAAARRGLACAAWRIQRRTPDLPPRDTLDADAAAYRLIPSP
ncbi:1-phosphofructokinase family hexose kinase [Piscinibacter gummiphilus]|uniref:Phosphofructokinase n=1 Tax=Piscinibacter gummiphilus TaxID=946333 RepID=A0A1W6L2M7_9BURK|nr:1-phosphofructokinase family hexose kinase [Piscinibacter gummiphilus]ARN18531.1 1-phosphofructokinase [Piscinibacter gummiphilus]ATU63158.1 1-phosphofructokinase [Piscinibacter gummiphilus]GLS95478.1 phosphofructokinase [Piscinibacter gummiphilus]